MALPAGRYRSGEFLGIDMPFCDPETSRFVLVPVAYDRATLSSGVGMGAAGSGTGRSKTGAARAILEASKDMARFDDEAFREWYRVGVTTRHEINGEQPPDAFADLLEAQVAEVLQRGRRPIVFGGERATALGPIRASAGKADELSVLHLGAHAALRESFKGSRYANECVMRRVVEFTPVTQVGIRSLAADEADQVDRGDVTTFFMNDVRGQNLRKDVIPRIVESLRPNVHLSIDMACFDPALVPGVAVAEPGGLDWSSMLEIARAVCTARSVIGVDLTELTPIAGHFVSEQVAARLLYKIIGFISQAQQYPELKA